MFRRKIFRRCPTCRYPLNPRLNIGPIGCCDKCGWAGSHHSHNYEDWIQFKVSAILILFGFAASYGIIRSFETNGRQSLRPFIAKVLNIAPNKDSNIAFHQANTSNKTSKKTGRTTLNKKLRP